MALSTPSGSLTPPSLPHSSGNLVEPADPRQDAEQYFDNQSYVKSVYRNNTALNIHRDAAVIDALKGYAAGTPIIVTWFSQIDSVADKQSAFSDLSFVSDTVNYGYLRINRFELRLQGPMAFTYDKGNVTSEFVGEGLVLPGFKARIGDLFTYSIEAGILGLFKVTGAPTRLSIRVGASHVVPFRLVKFLDNAEMVELSARVREESWFDKQRFLTEDGALLKSDDVVDLEYLTNKQKELSLYYLEQFYSEEYMSIIRPDAVYDPYVTKFVKMIVDTSVSGPFIEQLLPEAAYNKASFWEKLIDTKRVSWRTYAGYAYTKVYEVSVTSPKVTSLINRPYVELLKEYTDDYESVSKYISDNIGAVDTSSFTAFDTLLAFYLEYGVVDVSILYDLIDDVYDEEAVVQFYRIPIYLYLLWILEQTIHLGTKIRLTQPGQLPYLEVPFTQPDDRMEGNVLSVLSPSSKVVGILDNNGEPVFLNAADITYTADSFIIDFTAMKTELGIVDDLSGTWKVVITNTNLLIV